MGNVNRYGYYRKDRDFVMWGRFDALARRLRIPTSSALTLAAEEWLKNHADDPSPEDVIPPMPKNRKVLPIEKDPFK